ncbi:MAG: CYCXC family (seleno)protein [Acidobacteriota bacterium]|nr:CYCXC family (seleno)protein [Acidobacteriota bacterium]
MNKPVLFGLMVLIAVVCFAQGDRVPAYNDHPPQPGDALPILPKDQLWGEAFQHPYQIKSYEIAAKIPAVLSQVPCYCYCDRVGHNSLHSCFETTHGAHCGICMKELFYAYEQTKLKKTPAQIRAGIIKGDWKSIDLESVGNGTSTP